MYIGIKKCDKCGKEVREDSDKEQYSTGFEEIRIGFGNDYSANYTSVTYRLHRVSLQLCEECLKGIGVIRKEKNVDETKKDLMPAEALYNMVYGILEEINSQRQA